MGKWLRSLIASEFHLDNELDEWKLDLVIHSMYVKSIEDAQEDLH